MKLPHLLSMVLCFSFISRICAQDSVIALLDKIPNNSGYDFRCEDMIRVVNCLRGLGKEKGLEVLDRYLNAKPHADTENVLLVARVLFTNTNGWDVLVPGVPKPETSTNAYGLFPHFPIAFSDNVPFELVKGYTFSGFAGSPPTECLKECQKLSFINADITNTNYVAAAWKLIKSKSFEMLFQDPQSRSDMKRMILREAGAGDRDRDQK